MGSNIGRRCLAEFTGTFGIVAAPVLLSGAAGLEGADASLAAAAWVSGLSVLAMIAAFGRLSGAHFNPAVTLAFASARRFPWRYVPHYVSAQLLGAVLAGGVGVLIFGAGYGVHLPGVAASKAVCIEALLSFFLMVVIISVATDQRVDGATPAIAIGLTVVLDVWIGGAVTGGSMNPARSLGPAVFARGPALAGYWIYLIGPIIGAVAAAWIVEALRGDFEYGQGSPNDLCAARPHLEQEHRAY